MARIDRQGASGPSRRTFLVASGLGLSGLSPGRLATAGAVGEPSPTGGGSAKSTILFFLCGGASHLDSWDLKPDAPAEFRGPFLPIATSAPGVRLSEHLPLLASQAHHLAVVNSVGASVATNDHHAGYYYNLTGHRPDSTFLTLGNDRTPRPDDWPFMGTVVGSRRPPHPTLVNAITLPHKPSRAPYTRPGQFAARLGVEHDPLYLMGDRARPLNFQVPALTLQAEVGPERLRDRRALLSAVDGARREFDRAERVRTYSTLEQKALALLCSGETARAFDLADEPEAVRARYGETVNGMSLLMARRLVEAGVPFITVFWMEDREIADRCKSAGGWDTHGNNFNCLKEYLLPEFDRAFAGLIADLDDRGMLDQTLLLVTSEMGRKPRIGDPRSGGQSGAGRDHWTHCQSVLFAGGGIRGGQVYGSSDRVGAYPADRPVTPAHVAHTVYHAMGLQDLQATDVEGRPFPLLSEGAPIRDLF
ncbi:DUF1501 domain-containing protein [Tautonia sociabilis]|uniref:DUF1501 domain-containing protein n=1 Tax=Tautonia sociabilis TaxID=2080755 RepID=A0A432MFV5_9BACT|nr:DUF1501 domain-containing protein [Tautonia sociabilis]RUL85051.1 DUF1501 domain-containing protein [Tautonia sociabilis]